jgi:hypothetical protein
LAYCHLKLCLKTTFFLPCEEKVKYRTLFYSCFSIKIQFVLKMEYKHPNRILRIAQYSLFCLSYLYFQKKKKMICCNREWPFFHIHMLLNLWKMWTDSLTLELATFVTFPTTSESMFRLTPMNWAMDLKDLKMFTSKAYWCLI